MTKAEETPLVGRAADVALLSRALDEAAKGSGRTVFVVGEGGIGKTRLAAAISQRAQKKGWAVVSGRAYPVETGVPYAVFSDALVPVLRAMDPSHLAILTRGGASEFAQMFPNLSPGSEKSHQSTGADPAELKARLLWNFTQFLGRLSSKQPLFILLENLQWADASSLELLHFVARQIESQKVFLLGTYNDADRDANAVLRNTEQSLQRLGAVTVHKLTALSYADVEELVHRMFAAEKGATGHFTSLLYGWTRGNPFFIEETLKSLIESRALSRVDSVWKGWEIGNLQLPASIRDVLRSRIEKLSPHARTLPNLAALVGTRAPYETLLKVSGLTETDAIAALDELLSQRILEETGTVDAIRYDFTHPLLQQVIYSELGQARARVLHGTVAGSLESLYGRGAIEYADELAQHFARAHSEKLARKTVLYCHAAGRAALEKFANREAANYLAIALEALDRDSSIQDAPADEILTTLARTRQRLGGNGGAVERGGRACAGGREAGGA